MPNREQAERAKMHEHGGSVHEIIEILDARLRANSIMTPWEEVEHVVGESNGREVLDRAKHLMDQKQYSGVPLLAPSGVQGIYFRHDPRQLPRYEGIKEDHFVRADLGLLELIQQMRNTNRIAVIVGRHDCPSGWLTYADFSKRPFRMLLFAIVAEVEFLLAAALDSVHPGDSWIDHLQTNVEPTRDSRAQMVARKADATSWDTTMPLTTFAEIGHLIEAIGNSPAAIEALGETSDLANQLKSLPDLRNRVAHVVKPVVAGPGEIAKVAKQIELLRGWIERWPTRLNEGNSG